MQNRNGSAPSQGQNGGNGSAILVYLDSNNLTRACIAAGLSAALPEMVVVAASDPAQICDQGSERVDCIIAHICTDDWERNLANIVAMVKERQPSSKILILSDDDTAARARLAIELGAKAYVPTSLPTFVVSQIIRLVRVGGVYIPPSALSADFLPIDESLEGKRSLADPSLAQLTPRQVEVLSHLFQGKRNKTIAYELGMSEGTVKVHLRQIMKKMKARSRTQLVLVAKDRMQSSPTSTGAPDKGASEVALPNRQTRDDGA
jgi:DNA-binding NarL/FixJ family response regulator